MVLTQEQIKEFWELYGFTYKLEPKKWGFNYHGKVSEGVHDQPYWYTPDGYRLGWSLPSISLNNLFQYSVREYWNIYFWFDTCSGKQNCAIEIPDDDTGNLREYNGLDNTRILALFWALEQVKKEE